MSIFTKYQNKTPQEIRTLAQDLLEIVEKLGNQKTFTSKEYNAVRVYHDYHRANITDSYYPALNTLRKNGYVFVDRVEKWEVFVRRDNTGYGENEVLKDLTSEVYDMLPDSLKSDIIKETRVRYHYAFNAGKIQELIALNNLLTVIYYN